MIEHHIDITTIDGEMNTFVTYPEEGGPFPVIIFYMDAPGKREELHDMARRIATVGYYVVLPNLYYRKTREFSFVRDEQGMKQMFEMMNHLSIELVMRDTKAMLDFVDADENAESDKVGAVGYCMSGPYACAIASTFGERIKCSASVYGAGLVTKQEDSPHLNLDGITAEMYFACAEIDQYAPHDVIEVLQQQLESSGINFRLEWYPGAEHGFAFPDREGIYDKPSAERHWERLFSLFERNLRS